MCRSQILKCFLSISGKTKFRIFQSFEVSISQFKWYAWISIPSTNDKSSPPINMFAICRYQRNSCLYLKWSSFQLWPMRRKIFGSGPKESHYSFIDENYMTDYAKHVRKETKIVKLFSFWRCFLEVIFNGPRTFARVCILFVKAQKNVNVNKWTYISLPIWQKIAI